MFIYNLGGTVDLEDDYDQYLQGRASARYTQERNERIRGAIAWAILVLYICLAPYCAEKSSAVDFGKAERFKSGPLRVAPYPPMQLSQYGGVEVLISVFVEPRPGTRHLRVEWSYNGLPAGSAGRDLDENSQVEFQFKAIHAPAGEVTITAVIRERNGDTLGKVIHRTEKKAIVAGGDHEEESP